MEDSGKGNKIDLSGYSEFKMEGYPITFEQHEEERKKYDVLDPFYLMKQETKRIEEKHKQIRLKYGLNKQ